MAKASEIKREWHVVDASSESLGRLAARIAMLLMGKNKSTYSPYMDTGDFVIVINAAKVKVTGKKMTDKIYYRHTGYPGGLRSSTLGQMLDKHPIRAVEHAVRGMLPHNRLGRVMFGKLKVYPTDSHPHESQVRAGTVRATSKEGMNNGK
jgi:large subunit ribosomal protein L13